MRRATDMQMLANPAEAYRRVEIDAFIVGGQGAQLTRLCFAEAIGALNRSLYFDGKNEPEARGKCITKAISSVQALRMGIDRKHPIANALLTVYGNAIGRLASNMGSFEPDDIVALRHDLLEIEQAFAQASTT